MLKTIMIAVFTALLVGSANPWWSDFVFPKTLNQVEVGSSDGPCRHHLNTSDRAGKKLKCGEITIGSTFSKSLYSQKQLFVGKTNGKNTGYISIAPSFLGGRTNSIGWTARWADGPEVFELLDSCNEIPEAPPGSVLNTDEYCNVRSIGFLSK